MQSNCDLAEFPESKYSWPSCMGDIFLAFRNVLKTYFSRRSLHCIFDVVQWRHRMRNGHGWKRQMSPYWWDKKFLNRFNITENIASLSLTQPCPSRCNLPCSLLFQNDADFLIWTTLSCPACASPRPTSYRTAPPWHTPRPLPLALGPAPDWPPSGRWRSMTQLWGLVRILSNKDFLLLSVVPQNTDEWNSKASWE